MKSIYIKVLLLKSKLDASNDWNLVKKDMTYGGRCAEDIDYRYTYNNIKNKKSIILTINDYAKSASIVKSKSIGSDNGFSLVKRLGIKIK